VLYSFRETYFSVIYVLLTIVCFGQTTSPVPTPQQLNGITQSSISSPIWGSTLLPIKNGDMEMSPKIFSIQLILIAVSGAALPNKLAQPASSSLQNTITDFAYAPVNTPNIST
jgi:hypothetical protein